MAEIMETNMPHIMFLKQFPKSRRHIIRLNQIADYIDADITQVFWVSVSIFVVNNCPRANLA